MVFAIVFSKLCHQTLICSHLYCPEVVCLKPVVLHPHMAESEDIIGFLAVDALIKKPLVGKFFLHRTMGFSRGGRLCNERILSSLQLWTRTVPYSSKCSVWVWDSLASDTEFVLQFNST